ncbi:subtilisin-like protease SBT4.14 [Corylus avellana]|uniref:subtilisin-like protease SBT4.14 n=1 Tax=Corylus avellana TaxID=13451 RepID=UPI00286A35C3|nr:subtilisin-like protease SBT4.14 [Corylus avellana]
MSGAKYHRLLLPLLLVLIGGVVGQIGVEKKEYYIAFLQNGPVSADSRVQRNINLNVLSSVKGSIVDARKSMVYSYTSFNAFAAHLTKDEAQKLLDRNEVLHVMPNRYHQLQTTKSWDFVGLPLNARRNLKIESDIIVGLLDTGISPHAESFKDDGLGPPPARWKGNCRRYANFSGCNNKLIGAKYFKLDRLENPGDIISPVDVQGHGTHTSSTAVGSLVQNASLYGLAEGTARGAVPSARVAMYKVCWDTFGCSDMDLLAGFEAAINDGVDIISISIGGIFVGYDVDSIAIGSFHAMKKGILTVASAGNSGPSLGTVSNHAPWILTVAASGIDRAFRSDVRLGNGKSVIGIGVNTFSPKKALYPLVRGEDVALDPSTKEDARFCLSGSLNPAKAKGRIISCKLGEWGTDSYLTGIGSAGVILQSNDTWDSNPIFMSPATIVNGTIGQIIDNYINLTRSSSSGVIGKTHEIKLEPSPFIADFSSRGPNSGTKRVLKPDIAAPGVNILAAFTPLKSLTGLKGDTQFSKFSLLSGTSMACPHVAGAAGYVKSFHPNWSPAAIKSALITTATPMSQRVTKHGEFAYGAGQVNPIRATNPGLVYDMGELLYIRFLCHEGYNSSSLAVLFGSKSVNCTKFRRGIGYDDLNYPTIHLSLQAKQQTTTGVFQRVVTNVGAAQSVYNATIRAPKGVEITVNPSSLSFTAVNQTLRYRVVVRAKAMPSLQMVSGSLVWKSSRNIVRSPVVIYSP